MDTQRSANHGRGVGNRPHFNIQWWIFVLAGLIATAITLITISFQTIRAALANPVKSLNQD